MRRGSPGTPRKLSAPVTLLTALLAFGPGAGSLPLQSREDAEEAPQTAREDDGDLVVCPRCDEKGKATCARCGGEGQLLRNCRRCKGTGRRPCSQCTKEPENADVTTSPGEIPCTYCAGKGHLGSRTQKVCPQCGGSQVNLCPTCRGKGSFECPKLRVAGICPDCGMTGKVTCPLCKGTRRIARSLLQRESANLEGTKSANADERDSPQNGSSPGSDAATVEAADRDLEERFLGLKECYGRHSELFSQGLPEEVETAEKGIIESLRRLQSSAAQETPLYTELTGTRRRVDNLERRWAEIHHLYGRFQRSFLACQTAWEKERSSTSFGSESSRTKRQRFEPLEVRVSICERFCEQLDDEKPTWLLRESEAIHHSWTVMAVEVDEELKRIDEELRQNAEEDTEEPASVGDGGRAVPGGGSTPPSAGETESTQVTLQPYERNGGSATKAESNQTPDVESRGPRAQASPAPSAVADAPNDSKGFVAGASLLDGVLWVGSVLIAAGLLVVGGYWLRKMQSADTPGAS